MISTTTTWLCFVILEAFYGGALTMFFTSEVTIPLETTTDVLQAYPSWKLKFMDGNQMDFQGSNVPEVSSSNILVSTSSIGGLSSS